MTEIEINLCFTEIICSNRHSNPAGVEMKLIASTVLIVLSSLLLGGYALIWLAAPSTAVLIGTDSRIVFIHAIGGAGLLLAVMAFRELRRERNEAARLKQENESIV
ncbi:MAG: hypothetical protein QM599_10955 [Pseudoxanthomonas sp.]